MDMLMSHLQIDFGSVQACTIQMIRILLHYYFTVSIQYYESFLNIHDGQINTFSDEWG